MMKNTCRICTQEMREPDGSGYHLQTSPLDGTLCLGCWLAMVQRIGKVPLSFCASVAPEATSCTVAILSCIKWFWPPSTGFRLRNLRTSLIEKTPFSSSFRQASDCVLKSPRVSEASSISAQTRLAVCSSVVRRQRQTDRRQRSAQGPMVLLT